MISPIAVRALISLVPAAEIPWLHARTDTATFLAMFAVSLLAGLASGLLPAIRAARTDPARSLGSSGAVTNTSTMSRRMRNAAQVAQIALALVPLCGAGLLIRSFQHLQEVAPGFDPEHKLTLMFSVPRSRYAGLPEIASLARRISQETSQAPGIRRSAVVQALPFAPGARWLQAVTRNDPKSIIDLGQLPLVRYTVATAGYFEAMGIPLKAGRTLNEADDSTAQPVVVINEQLARAQFRGENPVGKRIWVGHAEALPLSRPRVIVGVVADTRMYSLESVPDPAAWVPIAQQENSDSILRNLYLVAHTSVSSHQRTRRDSRAHSRYRSRSCAERRGLHGGSSGRFIVAAAIQRHRGRRIQYCRAGNCGLGRLRDDQLRGGVPDFRDWRTHRDWRNAVRRS